MIRHCLRGRGAMLMLAAMLGTGIGVRAEPPTERLYAGRAPGSESWTEPEIEHRSPRGDTILENVSEPTLTAYAPASPPEGGTAVILLPGGALRMLSINEDTWYAIRALNARGITVFMLKYRVLQQRTQPAAALADGARSGAAVVNRALDRSAKLAIRNANANPAPGDAALDSVMRLAAADAQRALQMVRAGAQRWRIDPARVGYLGYSAGGGVALAEHLLAPIGSRPDFIATSYGPSLMDVQVGADAPPLFIATETNHGPVTDGLLALATLWREAGRPVELHMFEVPAFAMPSSMWVERFLEWLSSRGLLLPAAASAPVLTPVPAAAPAVTPTTSGYQRRSRYVPGWDSTRLVVDAYRPLRAGTVISEPLPVVYSLMRSGLRQQAAKSADGLAPAMIRPLLDHGYVIVAQDRRGEGASSGRQMGFVTRDDAGRCRRRGVGGGVAGRDGELRYRWVGYRLLSAHRGAAST